MASIELKPSGKQCNPSSMVIEMTVGDLPGVSSIHADAARGTVRLMFDPAVISAENIEAAMRDAGYILGRDWFAA